MLPNFKNIKRVMLCGDTHGNEWHMNYLYLKAVKYNVDAIVVLGDFGYWEHGKGGVQFLNNIDACYKESSIPTLFIDGNHENHQLLQYRYMGIWPSNEDDLAYVKRFDEMITKDYGDQPIKYSEEGFFRLRDGVWYIPRGVSWSWNGIRFLGIGGAFSVDRASRKLGVSWWEEEVLNDTDVEIASAAGQVDVVLAHDVPFGVPIETFLAMQHRFLSYCANSNENRKKLFDIVCATNPRWVFHGHLHIKYRSYLDLPSGRVIDVMGLNCDNNDEESFVAVNLDARLKEGQI